MSGIIYIPSKETINELYFEIADWSMTEGKDFISSTGAEAQSGEMNSFYGQKHSAESRAKIKENHYDCSGKNNSFYGKTHTDEVKKKLSSYRGEKNYHTGRKRSDDFKRKLREANLGKTLDAEHRKKVSDAMKGKKKYTNGTINQYCSPDEIPKGFFWGWILKSGKVERYGKTCSKRR